MIQNDGRVGRSSPTSKCRYLCWYGSGQVAGRNQHHSLVILICRTSEGRLVSFWNARPTLTYMLIGTLCKTLDRNVVVFDRHDANFGSGWFDV